MKEKSFGKAIKGHSLPQTEGGFFHKLLLPSGVEIKFLGFGSESLLGEKAEK